MKLLLALLAILTGLTGGEVVRMQGASPSVLGAAAVLVEASAEAGARIAGHRPVQSLPSLVDSACNDAPLAAIPAATDFTPRGPRALE